MNTEVEKESKHLHPKIIYQPKEVKDNQVSRFRKFVKRRYGMKLDDYWELHEWSRQNYREFWECLYIFFDVISSQAYCEVFEKNGSFESTEWFKGAKLNYAENVLRVRSSKTAIITLDEHDNTEHISYEQLYNEVALYADVFKDSGLKKGDVVACFISNKVEAVYAYLATASIGALWIGALPLLGAKAVVSRFAQWSPKILFAGGNFYFDGKEINMVQKVTDAIKSLPSLQKVVFVPSKDNVHAIQELPGCISIEDFLKLARERITSSGTDIKFEQVPFNHPLCVIYTSGTTGTPKAIVHPHGSLLTHLKDYGLFWDTTNDDVLLSYSPAGWGTWNFFVSSLYFGITIVLYDGLPFEETPTRFWDIVDKFRITSSYIRCSSAEAMERKQYIPTENHSLKSLKGIYPLGSVCKPHTYEFFTKDIKPGLFFCSVLGTTEYLGLLSGLDSNLPVYKGEIQCVSLGYDLRVVDSKGNYIVGQRGELVQLNPTPTTPVACIAGNSKNKIKETYLTKYPGAWYIGDDTWISPETKGFVIYGRSDDVMKPKSSRFNCSEIYYALKGFPGLVDSICVSKFNSKMEERVILFVTMLPGHSITSEVEEQIRKIIEESLSYEHLPDLILAAPGIPYNINGKKLNSLVKKLINKEDVHSDGNNLNPDLEEFFRNLDLGDI